MTITTSCVVAGGWWRLTGRKWFYQELGHQDANLRRLMHNAACYDSAKLLIEAGVDCDIADIVHFDQRLVDIIRKLHTDMYIELLEFTPKDIARSLINA